MSVWLICGGRDFNDWACACEVLDRVASIRGLPSLVVGGGARGADTLGMRWAAANKVRRRVFVADWERDGESAGPQRNQRMLDEGCPDLVVAFPGDVGTADMVARARKAGVKVLEVQDND